MRIRILDEPRCIGARHYGSNRPGWGGRGNARNVDRSGNLERHVEEVVVDIDDAGEVNESQLFARGAMDKVTIGHLCCDGPVRVTKAAPVVGEFRD